MKDYQEEFDKGRVVRGFMTKEGVENMLSGDAVYPHISPDKGGDIDQRVLLVLPPKSLEITGMVCDSKRVHPPVCGAIACPLELDGRGQDGVDCREVTLVEKGACQCQK